MFAPASYRDRRRALRDALAGSGERGLLLFLGNDESPMNYADNTYPFRQDSTFLYFFGRRPARASRRSSTSTRARHDVFADDLDDGRHRLDGSAADAWRSWRRGAASPTRAPAAALADGSRGAWRQGGASTSCRPYRRREHARLIELLGVRAGATRGRRVVEFIRAVVEQRAVKSAEEVARDRARRRHSPSTCTSRHAPWRGPGMTRGRDRGAGHRDRPGGRRQPGLPGDRHRSTARRCTTTTTATCCRPGDCSCSTAGAESAEHYAGDLTSTFPVDRPLHAPPEGRLRGRPRRAPGGHRGGLRPACRSARSTCWRAARLAEGLKDLGLMKGDLDEAVRRGRPRHVLPVRHWAT